MKEIILAIETFKNDISRYLHEKKSKILIDKAVDSIVGIENFSMDNLVEIVKQEIFQEDVTAVEQIETLLNLDKEIFYRWYQYINRNYEEDIIYHTFHSTKGLEYDNVVMVFGDSFGRSKSYFNNYFAGYNQELKDNELELYRKARNLLYVAATRARINLRILYTGDYKSKKEIFDIIFGKVDLWKREDASEK